MVICTAEAAANFFKNHDASFSDRPVFEAFRSHDFHKSSMSICPHDAYQRFMKRMCKVEMFSNERINTAASVSVRQKCVNDLLAWVRKEEGREVHVSRLVFLASFNVIGNMVLSRDLVDPQSTVGSVFFATMMRLFECLGLTNISDVFPWLRWFDLQGIRKKMDCEMGKVLEITSGFVKQRIIEREKEKGRKSGRKDVLDILLDFESSENDKQANLSEKQISIFVLEMFIGGTESTSSTIEWALTELLRNPKIMIKVKAELTKIIGPYKKLEENDVAKLHYLQAVIKETIRLHPPAPFLVPRKAIEDVNFMGYHIPKNTQVFVNVWGIGRDQECWDEPLSFNPERFLDSKIDFKGQHYEFIPFGAGRRMCPGILLPQHTMPLFLGSLLHEFDWELGSQVSHDKIDMREKLSMALSKLEPLKAIPRKLRQVRLRISGIFEYVAQKLALLVRERSIIQSLQAV
ncbi:hypothetical protein LguiA_018152 [Lonicera macranthoides]